MALVNYSSGESVDEEPPTKRRRPQGTKSESKTDPDANAEADGDANGSKPDSKSRSRDSAAAADRSSSLPPLPNAFHDLYASTVRQSVGDDPGLHQGRKRLTPHVPGKWPSHVYVEWHPTHEQHDKLAQLLSSVDKELNGEVELHKLLTSDLGAPLPLHISLSRPLSVRTADKDAFLERVSSSIRGSGVAPFTVTPRALAWYMSPDSDRAFLILRVTAPAAAPSNDMVAPNPQLLTLLTRCNTAATMFGQSPLYQQTRSEPVGSAFHVSIAWSFGIPTDATSLRALKVLKEKRFADVRAWHIDVSGVKVKIGNAVHHIELMPRNAAADGHVFER